MIAQIQCKIVDNGHFIVNKWPLYCFKYICFMAGGGVGGPEIFDKNIAFSVYPTLID